jgi:outer membrane receptor for ferrienterochelin and colicins
MYNLLKMTLLVALFAFNAAAQNITGLVTNELEEPLVGATVFWKGTTQGFITDTLGKFNLPAQKQAAILVVNYVGYEPVETEILPEENNIWIEVKGVTQLNQVTIEGQGFGTRISTLDPYREYHEQRVAQSTMLQPVRKFSDQWCY